MTKPSTTVPVDAEATNRVLVLARILETFTETLDLDELLRRIVEVTVDQLGADRAWLLYPANLTSSVAEVAFEATRNGFVGAFEQKTPIPLGPSRPLLERTLESTSPIVNDRAELDPAIAEAFHIRSQLVQALRPRVGDPWIFGLHQCSHERVWSSSEIELFQMIGRYATIGLNNALLHRRAVTEAAKVRAILDQMPEATAIYDDRGVLQMLNRSAEKVTAHMFAAPPDLRIATNRHRELSGRPLDIGDLPANRALRGEQVNAEYLVFDPKAGEDRVLNMKAAPIINETDKVVGAVVLARDVTDERAAAEREVRRRRQNECLANLGLDLVEVQASFTSLDLAARRIGDAISGNVFLYLYHAPTDELQLVGSHVTSGGAAQLRDFVQAHPYRPGEGLPGTVFQIGRPLLFGEIRGDAVVDFGRTEEEKSLKRGVDEKSLIAHPIEWYGERLGALIISHSDPRQGFEGSDVDFARSVADRIGASAHINRLTRVALEGHRAAEELARREVDARTRLEAVLESAPIGIAVISPDELRFEMANSRWMEFAAKFGKVAPDNRIIDLRVAEVIPGWEASLKEVADRGETKVEDLLLVRDGPHTWYFNRIISPVRGRYSGATQNLTVLVQDVTDQVRAKREIEALAQLMEERSARLDSILSSMTDALWVYDADGVAIDVNKAAVDLFGLGSRSEAIARGALIDFNLRYPDGRPIPMDDLPQARAIRGDAVPDFLAVARHLLTGRDVDLSIAAAPIQSGGIVGAVLVMRDITALQELDRKKDEFLSVASHELRTPLTTIKGYTQLLAQTVNDPDPHDRSMYLKSVLGEIDRMMGLISELLDVSRIETNRLQIYPQAIRWLEFLEQQSSAFRIRHPNRPIIFHSEVKEVTLLIDPDRMRQVIDNLLSNALKYSGDQSHIDVRVESCDGNIETSVTDYGIGIPRDELPQLFERFHRARNVSSRYYGGLGLGLYIARAIVEAHGGAIRVISEEGKGSTFTVSLPILGGAPATDQSS